MQRAVQPIFDEALADAPHGALTRMQRGGNPLILLAFIGVQEDLGAIDHPGAGRTCMDEHGESLSLVVAQFDHIDFLPHRRLLRDAVRLPPAEEIVKITVAEN
jgi:hypothetical protein